MAEGSNGCNTVRNGDSVGGNAVGWSGEDLLIGIFDPAANYSLDLIL